ncbi:hypothetical protein C2U69_12540 [Cupriavidus pinatubonensis]|nr:hypothetical protein C2U69_12540 [Cupriavidus pinatubonensis]
MGSAALPCVPMTGTVAVAGVAATFMVFPKAIRPCMGSGLVLRDSTMLTRLTRTHILQTD